MTKFGILSGVLLTNPPPAGERSGKPWLLPFVFTIIAVVFLILALVGPWGTMRANGEMAGEDFKLAYDYGLQSYSATSDAKMIPEPGSDPYNPTLTDELTVSYNDKPEDGGLNGDVDKGGGPGELDAWNICFYLAIVAVIIGILMLVFTLVAGTKRSAQMGKFAMIFAILAAVSGFLAPVYAATGIPAGVEDDYNEEYKDWDEATMGEKPDLHNKWWDSWDQEDAYSKTEITVGAGWGFYLSLIGGILALLGGIFILKMNKKFKEASPAAPPPPAPVPPPPKQPPQ
jgi:hypothetical protein